MPKIIGRNCRPKAFAESAQSSKTPGSAQEAASAAVGAGGGGEHAWYREAHGINLRRRPQPRLQSACRQLSPPAKSFESFLAAALDRFAGFVLLVTGPNRQRMPSRPAGALSLDSVIQSQSSTNPTVVLQPDQPHLGPVQLTVIPYSRISLDDNINLTATNTESDVIVGAGATVGAAWQVTGKSVVQLSSQIGYNFYLNHPDHDYLQISPGSALTWGFKLSDWLLTFFDQFNYTRNDIAVASVSNVSGIPIVDNTLGMRAQWQPGNWLTEAGYSYDNYFSTSTQFNYLNNDADYFFTRGAWLFSEHGQLGVEGSASYTYFSHPPQNNNNSYSVGPYVQWQPDPFINVSLHGGPTFYSFAPNASNPTQNNLTSYYVNLDVFHQMTEFLSEELTLNRSVSLGIGSGSPYYQQLSVDYLVRWYAKPWLNFFLRLDYQQGQQPYQEGFQFVDRPPFIVPFYGTEYYNREGVSPGVSYQVTRKISASLVYSHWTRGSNFSQNTYNDDDVTFQLQYAF